METFRGANKKYLRSEQTTIARTIPLKLISMEIVFLHGHSYCHENRIVMVCRVGEKCGDRRNSWALDAITATNGWAAMEVRPPPLRTALM